MGTHKLAGFTIIETMLFLAISGFLIASLIVGAGASVNVQRYRDATETFKSFLQQQYADLTSVQNGRSDSWSCGSTAVPNSTGPVFNNRGQSDCILVGKYVNINGGDITTFTLIGYKKTATTKQPDDIASLKNNYVLNISQGEAEKSAMEWGTQISYPTIVNGTPNPVPTTPRKLSFLVVRSPDSGQIYTFTNTDPNVPDVASITSSTFTNMLVAGDTTPGQGAQLICIDTSGLFVSNDRGVYLNNFASGASAIEIRSNAYMTTIGQKDQC